MATTGIITPYSTAMPFVQKKPSWVNEYDAQRLASYDLYEDLVRNRPDALQALLRGTDEKPLLIPTAKKIVNTLCRYVLRGWHIDVVPADDPVTGEPLTASEEDTNSALIAYGTLFKRERFLTQIRSLKKDLISKGDAYLYIVGDPDKPQNRRLSIRTLDPRIVFPIYEDHDPDTITGIDLIEQYVVGSDSFIKRQRFLKPSNPLHPSFGDYEAPIAREITYLEMDGWEDPEKAKQYSGDRTGHPDPLPMEILDGIYHLPIYHFRNNEESGNPFGTSDLSGLEAALAGINQAATDQDLALAMAGLGFYVTDSGAPVDDDGNDVAWIIGPQRVVEVGENKTFQRVSGVASVEPSISHIEFVEDRLNQTTGLNDVALGVVDTTVAESGIALEIRMGPLLDATGEKDESALEVLDQFLYDLREWFSVYEDIQIVNVVAISVLQDKMPKNRAQRMEELKNLYLDGVISLQYYHKILEDEFGFVFPPGMINELLDGGMRMDQEMAGAGGPGGPGDPDAEDDTEDDTEEI